MAKCQWNYISSQFINEELDDGNLILYLLGEYAKEFQESKCAEIRLSFILQSNMLDRSANNVAIYLLELKNNAVHC